MGDKPSACLMEIVVKLATKLFGSHDPVAATRILHDRFIDDVTSGGTKVEVERFRGKEGEDLQCDGTMPTILCQAGLLLKAIAIPGEPDGPQFAKLGASALEIN